MWCFLLAAGCYRAIRLWPLAFSACARSLPDHLEGTFTASEPCCRCQGSAREKASQRLLGTTVSYWQTRETEGWIQQGLSEIRLCKAGGSHHRENSPSCGISACRGIHVSRLGNFPFGAPCKTKSTLPALTPACEGVQCQRVKGVLKMG